MDKPPSIIWEKAVTSKQNFGKNKALSVQTEFSLKHRWEKTRMFVDVSVMCWTL